jgi:hypothetical protein
MDIYHKNLYEFCGLLQHKLHINIFHSENITERHGKEAVHISHALHYTFLKCCNFQIERN